MDLADYILSASTALLGLALWSNTRRTQRLQRRVAQLEARLAEGGAGAGTAAEGAGAARAAADLSLDDVQPLQLYGCSADGKVLLGVKKLDAAKLAKLPKSPIAGAEAKLGAIAALLQAAPALLPHARLSGQPMEVLLNGPMAATRGSEPMVAMVKGATGKVVELSRLKGVPALAPLSCSAITATAVAVAARLSVDGIAETLGELLKGLTEVRGVDAAERKATLAEAVKHLRDDVLQAVQRGNLSPVLVSDLEQVDHGLAEVQRDLHAQHRKLHRGTKGLHCKGEFDPDEFFKLLSDHVRNLDATRKQYVLTLKARLVCWQFLNMFPQDGEAHAARRQTLADATRAAELGTDYEPVVQALTAQIDALDDSLSDDKTLAHRKAGMKVYAQNAFENTRQQLDEIRESLERLAAAAAEQITSVDKPTRLAVRLGKGKFEAFELQDAPARAGAQPARPAATAAAAA